MISALPTRLVSSPTIFISILKDSFNVSISYLLWALAYIFSSVWNTLSFFYLFIDKHAFSYKLQKFIFKQALGKEEFIRSTLQYLTWRAVVIQALETTGTRNLNAAWTPFLSLSLMSIPLWCELHSLLLQLPSSTCRREQSCGNALSPSRIWEPPSQLKSLLYWIIISNPSVPISNIISSKNPNYKLL